MKMKYLLFAFLSIWCVMADGQTQTVKVSMRNGTVITGEMVEFDPLDHIIIKIGNKDITIPMAEVAFVDNKNLSANQNGTVKDTVEVVDNLANYKGFLLAKGNNVYVYCNNEKYEMAAAKDLKSYLIRDGFWNVVDNMIDAHFTISYIVDLNGLDKAYVSIGSWRTGETILLGATYTDESIFTNRRVVGELYKKHVVPFQKKIEKGTVSKSTKRNFTIE